MNRKITFDLLILIFALTGLALSYIYLKEESMRYGSLLLLSLVLLGSIILLICDGRTYGMLQERKEGKGITQLLLLGEEQKYRVSSREPCRVERGDVIYIGLAPIRLR